MKFPYTMPKFDLFSFYYAHLHYTKLYQRRSEKRLISTLANPLLIQRSAKSQNTSFTNRQHPDLRPSELSRLFTSFTQILSLNLTPWPDSPNLLFFHGGGKIRLPLPPSFYVTSSRFFSRFIHLGFIHT